MNILLIEPDRKLADNYRAILRAHGHAVRLVSGAQAAIHAMDEAVPDAVILELQLVQHNGVEFLHELRSYPEWQEVPVIVLSFVRPADFTTDESLLTELGIRDYLYKPELRLDQLVRTVQRIERPLFA